MTTRDDGYCPQCGILYANCIHYPPGALSKKYATDRAGKASFADRCRKCDGNLKWVMCNSCEGSGGHMVKRPEEPDEWAECGLCGGDEGSWECIFCLRSEVRSLFAENGKLLNGIAGLEAENGKLRDKIAHLEADGEQVAFVGDMQTDEAAQQMVDLIKKEILQQVGRMNDDDGFGSGFNAATDESLNACDRAFKEFIAKIPKNEPRGDWGGTVLED